MRAAAVRKYYGDPQVFDEARSRLGDNFIRWRHVRVLLSNGRFAKVKRGFSSWEELRRTISRMCGQRVYPVKIWYSVARWLSPKNLGPRKISGRPGYQVADNLMLDQRLFVADLDENPKENAVKLLGWLRGRPDLRLVYIAESGGGGLHIALERDFDGASMLPPEREQMALKMNERLVAEMKEAGIKIDGIVRNPRQIVKLPMSLDAQTGNVCRFVDDLHLLSAVSCSSDGNIPNDDKNRRSSKPVGVEQREASQKTGVSGPPTFVTAVKSVILGTKGLHVPLLDLGRELDLAVATASRLISRCGLSTVYLFDDGRRVVGVSLKAVSLRRLRKIQSSADLKKYKQRFLFLDELVYLGKVKGRPSAHLSKGHSLLLRRLGINCPIGEVGSGEVKAVKFMVMS